MMRSSRGCRITSSTERLNSGNSSRNNMPLCASDISPGTGLEPPPTSATGDIVWWGERNGRRVSRRAPLLRRPATECIFVVSRASARVRGGMMEGRRFAIMDLPEPGGPTSSMLWPPAHATSNARFTFSCPLTSEKSTSVHPASRANSLRVSTMVGSMAAAPETKSSTCESVSTPYTSRLFTTAASVALARGSIMPLNPAARAAMAMGNAPRTGSTEPSSESSPIIM